LPTIFSSSNSTISSKGNAIFSSCNSIIASHL
jgi:hypothetical protein